MVRDMVRALTAVLLLAAAAASADEVAATPGHEVAATPDDEVAARPDDEVITSADLRLLPFGRRTRGFEEALVALPRTHEAAFGLQLNGATGPESRWRIDGLDVTDPRYGGQGLSLPVELIESIRLRSDAGFGGLVDTATLRAPNAFHGSVFAHWSPGERSRAVHGSAVLATYGSTGSAYDLGMELGGPIVPDRLTFHVALVPEIENDDVDRVISARQDDGTGRPVLDPVTGAPLVTEVGRSSFRRRTQSLFFQGKLALRLGDDHGVTLSAFGDPAHTTGATGSALGSGGPLFLDRTSGAMGAVLRYSGAPARVVHIDALAGVYRRNFSADAADVGAVSAAQLRDTPQITFRGALNLLSPQLDDPANPDAQRNALVQEKCAIAASGFDPCPVRGYVTGGPGGLFDGRLDRLQAQLALSHSFELLGRHLVRYGADVEHDALDVDRSISGGALVSAAVGNGGVSKFTLVGYGRPDPAKPGQPARDPSGKIGRVAFHSTTGSTLAGAFVSERWTLLGRVTLEAGVRAQRQTLAADPAFAVDAAGNRVSDDQVALTSVIPGAAVSVDALGDGRLRAFGSFTRAVERLPLDLADTGFDNPGQLVYATNASSCTNPKDPRTCAVIPGGVSGRTYGFFGGSPGLSTDPRLTAQRTDLFRVGAAARPGFGLVVGADYRLETLRSPIEGVSPDGGNTFLLTNPAGAKRRYEAFTVSLHRPFGEHWLLRASWTHGSLTGTYPGLAATDRGQLAPNHLGDFDDARLLRNREGPLPGDVPNAVRGSAAYVLELPARVELSLGAVLRAEEGTPLSYLGADTSAGANSVYVLPRGAAGRLPWTTQLDLRIGASKQLSRSVTLSLDADVFNVLGGESATAADQTYTFDAVGPVSSKGDLAFLKTTAGTPVTPNARFLATTAQQPPLSGRLGARISF